MMSVVLLTQHQMKENVNILVSVIKHVLRMEAHNIDGVVVQIINIIKSIIVENIILVLDVLLKVQKYLQVQVIKI